MITALMFVLGLVIGVAVGYFSALLITGVIQ
jgi:hypothetical protein